MKKRILKVMSMMLVAATLMTGTGFNEIVTVKADTVYDENGYDAEGYDRDGYDRNGYDKNGYDRENLDKYGCYPSGYDRDGYDRYGYNRWGYDKNGYDKEGMVVSFFQRVVGWCETINGLPNAIPFELEPRI